MLILTGAMQAGAQTPLVTKAPAGKWAIVMHGGAGVIERASMRPETEKEYRAGMDRAIRAAAEVLDGAGRRWMRLRRGSRC